MSGQKDFLNILREIRGTAAPGEAATDGIWYELTVADKNGNAGVYGDILAKYGVVTESAGTFDQAVAILENLNVEVTTIGAGLPATSQLVNGVWQLGIPEGVAGTDGVDGFTPEVRLNYAGGNITQVVTVNGVEVVNELLLDLDTLVNNVVNANVDIQTTLTAKQEVIDAVAEANQLNDDLLNKVTTGKSELDTYTTTKIDELEVAKDADKAELDSHTVSKIAEFDANSVNELSSYNNNATSKLNEYNNNASTKLSQYNDNHVDRTNDLNTTYANRVVEILNSGKISGMFDVFEAQEPTNTATFLTTTGTNIVYYLNGTRMVEGVDYTITNSTDITLAGQIAYGDVVAQLDSTLLIDIVTESNVLLTTNNTAEIKVAYESNDDTNAYTDSEKTKVANTPADTVSELATKQDTLVSQVNIKSINGTSLLNSGDLTIAAGSGGFAAALYFSDTNSIINGAYKTLSYIPDVAATTETIVCNSGETAGSVYLFDLPIETTVIDAGKWLANLYCSVDLENGDTRIRYEGFMRNSAGVETTLFTATSPELTSVPGYVDFEITEPVKNVDPTARYGIRLFAFTDANQDRTVSITIGDGFASYTNTPLAIRHDQLRDRDRADAHPIAAITDLQTELDSKLNLSGGTITGTVVFEGDIIQNGASYETHAEQVYTTKDEVILRDGAVAGLGSGVAGIRAKLYDGTNDGLLAFDSNGIARVGDEGALQALATREDVPLDSGLAKWNDVTSRFETTRDIDVDSITVSGTVDGRDVSTDGTKLDLITVTSSIDLDNIGTIADFEAALNY